MLGTLMKDLKEFCYKYDAYVKPSSQQYRRTTTVPYKVFEEQGMTAFDQRTYETVPMVDITMPEDRFRALLEHDKWIEKAGLHDNQFFSNNVSRVSNLIVEHERECRLRQQHVSLQKAWEQYQILLSMYYDGR
jgi:hypothetical protein